MYKINKYIIFTKCKQINETDKKTTNIHCTVCTKMLQYLRNVEEHRNNLTKN